MKVIVFSAMLCCVISLPTFAELTPEDLDKIRLIVKLSVHEMLKVDKAAGFWCNITIGVNLGFRLPAAP